MKYSGMARAHTNIALIKYWGKRDKALFLPMNSSLSMTLDAFYTDTKVTFLPQASQDEFVLNEEVQGEQETAKISAFLDLFRKEVGVAYRARVESLNFVPTAAGLASSASAFAALALATQEALGVEMDRGRLSTFARRGSGSATRSLFGGFVEWDKGTDSENSMAQSIDAADWDLAMIVLAVQTERKKVSSRVGMDHTVATSPFYEAWVSSTQKDLEEMKEAIAAKDFTRLGQIAEHNGMKMHATTLSANPPFTYWNAATLEVQEAIRSIREKGQLEGYMTMDAGPNVKLLCPAHQLEEWIQRLKELLPTVPAIASRPGPAAHLLTDAEWQASQEEWRRKGWR